MKPPRDYHSLRFLSRYCFGNLTITPRRKTGSPSQSRSAGGMICVGMTYQQSKGMFFKYRIVFQNQVDRIFPLLYTGVHYCSPVQVDRRKLLLIIDLGQYFPVDPFSPVDPFPPDKSIGKGRYNKPPSPPPPPAHARTHATNHPRTHQCYHPPMHAFTLNKRTVSPEAIDSTQSCNHAIGKRMLVSWK